MVTCTDQEVNCAPQRLLRREGDVDLKERRGHNVNTAPITLTHAYYKIQTCTDTTSHQTYCTPITQQNCIISIKTKSREMSLVHFGPHPPLLWADRQQVSHFNKVLQIRSLDSTEATGGGGEGC